MTSASRSQRSSNVNIGNTNATVDEHAPAIHPHSKWEESPRDDELTLWEIHRPPRALVSKNRRIQCSLKMLNPHFQCVICLGYLKETTTVMVCLHRFCGECINKCIRIGMKECPSCRKPIPSRRSLRRDEKFDMLVNRMMGTPSDRQQSEDQRGQEDAKTMVHLQKAILKKKLLDKEKLQHGGHSKRPTVITFNRCKSILNLEESPLMDVEIRRHPRESQADRLERPFLTLRKDANVSSLKRFLSQKLKSDEYEVSSRLDDDSVVLDDDLTLADTKNTLLPNSAPETVLVLKYRRATNIDGGKQGNTENSGGGAQQGPQDPEIGKNTSSVGEEETSGLAVPTKLKPVF